MTQREFYTVIAAIENLDVELRDFAQAAIDKIDEDNAKKREKAAKKREENEPVKVAILEVLGDEPKPASEVGVEVEISTSKASAMLRQLVEEGRAAVTDIKGKKGKVKGYTVV